MLEPEHYYERLGCYIPNVVFPTAALIHGAPDELKILLAAYMIQRALIEVEHELEHRPAWIRIPVHGILEQLGAEG